MSETLTESGVVVYYRSMAWIPGRRARIGRIFLRVSHAHGVSCVHARVLILAFCPVASCTVRGYDR